MEHTYLSILSKRQSDIPFFIIISFNCWFLLAIYFFIFADFSFAQQYFTSKGCWLSSPIFWFLDNGLGLFLGPCEFLNKLATATLSHPFLCGYLIFFRNWSWLILQLNKQLRRIQSKKANHLWTFKLSKAIGSTILLGGVPDGLYLTNSTIVFNLYALVYEFVIC